MTKMKKLDWVAIILLIVGGLNWGLVGAFGFDLVEFLTMGVSWLSRTIYGLVGLSALYSIKVFFVK